MSTEDILKGLDKSPPVKKKEAAEAAPAAAETPAAE